MWYHGEASHSGVGGAAIGYATSADGIIWQKYAGNPVLKPGVSGEWDNNNLYYPKVEIDGAKYHMLYMGGKYPLYQIGHAVSPDGICWTKSRTAIDHIWILSRLFKSLAVCLMNSSLYS